MATRQRYRSKAYPAVDLREALDLLREYVSQLGWKQSHSREKVAQALGFASGTTGVAIRRIAALTHFGLLGRDAGRFKPTDLGRRLLEERDSSRHEELLQEAFLRPKLFRDLVVQGRDLRGLGDLPDALVRYHGIANSAKYEVTRIFVDSAQFAKIPTPDGAFSRHQARRSRDVGEDPNSDGDSVSGSDDQSAHLHTEISIPILLTEDKRAELRIPVELNEKDIQLLRSQVDLLNQRVEFNKHRAEVVPFRGQEA